MCGIAGFYSSNYKHVPEKVNAVLKSIAHRGPDGHGVDSCDLGFMVHTRLSILDPSEGGVQPFVKFDGTLVSAHNGEIYNHDELREEILGSYHFDGYSDSEIIPYLYKEIGPMALCNRLQGMFAFVLLDKVERVVYLCRDTFGIKPLYYRIINGGISFGSEIKALLAMDFPASGIRHQAVMDFLSLGYIPEPDTIYKDIHAVPRGSFLKFSLDTCIHSCFTYAEFDPLNNLCDNDELDVLLRKVIAEQSVADFPVGSLLSGGVDSSLVSSYFAEVNDAPKTFTVAFRSSDRDESDIARKTASAIGSIHSELDIGSVMEWNAFHQLIRHFDQPFGDLSLLPTFAICEQVRKNVKVVLTGDGGDEFAGGYAKFRLFRYLSIMRILPFWLRSAIYQLTQKFDFPFRTKKFLKLAVASPEEQLYGLSAIAPESLVRSLIRADINIISPRRLFIYDSQLDFAQNVSINQCNTSLVSKMLPKVDRMSMLAGIEARVPLLDTRITNCLFSMQPKKKISGLIGKVVFREILHRRLPAYNNKRKTGFDFDYKEFDTLGWTSRMVSAIRESTVRTNTVWNILDSAKTMDWLQLKESGMVKNMSRQAQFQLVVNLYVLVIWFGDR